MNPGNRIPDAHELRLFGSDIAAEPSHSHEEMPRPVVENRGAVAKTKNVHSSPLNGNVEWIPRGGKVCLCSSEVADLKWVATVNKWVRSVTIQPQFTPLDAAFHLKVGSGSIGSSFYLESAPAWKKLTNLSLSA